jgi:DNA transformation protein
MNDLDQLPGFGPKSKLMLAAVGVHSCAQFFASDPYQLYARLKAHDPKTSLNMLYAILGAQANCHWQEIKRTQRTEILLRLDDLGLAPKVPKTSKAPD